MDNGDGFGKGLPARTCSVPPKLPLVGAVVGTVVKVGVPPAATAVKVAVATTSVWVGVDVTVEPAGGAVCVGVTVQDGVQVQVGGTGDCDGVAVALEV